MEGLDPAVHRRDPTGKIPGRTVRALPSPLGPPPGQPGQPPYGYPQQPPASQPTPAEPAYGFGPYAGPAAHNHPATDPVALAGLRTLRQPGQPVPAPPPQKKGKGKGLIIGGVIALALILIGVVPAVLVRGEPAVTTVPSPNASTTGSVPHQQQRSADQRTAGGEGLGRGQRLPERPRGG